MQLADQGSVKGEHWTCMEEGLVQQGEEWTVRGGIGVNMNEAGLAGLVPVGITCVEAGLAGQGSVGRMDNAWR